VDEHTQVTLFLSADDSASQASPVIARRMIREGLTVPPNLVRPYEFLNYYTIRYAAPPDERLRVVPQMVADGARPGVYRLQVGVQAPRVTRENRPPLNLTFTLDTSGSMKGRPMELQKAVVHAVARELRPGDVVSMVTWDTRRTVLLESREVAGPEDAKLLRAIRALEAGGGTDLNSGLREGYRLARRNHREGWLNRVIVVSDGLANVGVTEREVIAAAAADGERDGIYLMGVGTGNGYDDTMMDTITEAGRGAYLFVDSAAEVARQLSGERLVANLGLAAMDVRLRLRLPPTFRVVEFWGEQMSEQADEVRPQHLAPNTAMVYHQAIGSCSREPFRDDDLLEVSVDYRDPASQALRREEVIVSGAELGLGSPDGGLRPQLVKGSAVLAYADALREVWGKPPQQARPLCGAALAVVAAARQQLVDSDLDEVAELLATYCQRCATAGCGPSGWNPSKGALQTSEASPGESWGGMMSAGSGCNLSATPATARVVPWWLQVLALTATLAFAGCGRLTLRMRPRDADTAGGL